MDAHATAVASPPIDPRPPETVKKTWRLFMFGKLFLTSSALAAVTCCLVAATASASPHLVSGVQSPGGTAPACSDSSASYTMTGGLVGCWYSDTGAITNDQLTASGIYLVNFAGTEHFIGCLDVDQDRGCAGDPSGALYFSFTFTGQYDAVTGNEIRGRCHHPVVGSSGDFAGATGVINFKDDVSNGTAAYMGQINF